MKIDYNFTYLNRNFFFVFSDIPFNKKFNENQIQTYLKSYLVQECKLDPLLFENEQLMIFSDELYSPEAKSTEH